LQSADESIKFNIETTLLHAGGSDSAVAAADDMARAELTPGDQARVDKLKGIALLRQGRYREAVGIFARIADRGQLDAAAVIYYYRALRSCGRTDEALSLLRREAMLRDDANIYHHLADAYLKAEMIYEALGVYENALSRPGCPRKYMVDHARILKILGGAANRAKVRELCNKVLDPAGFSAAPLTAEDFYYSGFANYLLGDHPRARYDYERSGKLYEYYDQFD
jgi:tetratricopeptide (TPR) repeat protein